jgi:hypothetical protein
VDEKLVVDVFTFAGGVFLGTLLGIALAVVRVAVFLVMHDECDYQLTRRVITAQVMKKLGED